MEVLSSTRRKRRQKPAKKAGKKEKEIAPIDKKAVETKAKLDHKFVTINKDGTTSPLTEEEGQAALTAALVEKTPTTVVVGTCPCYGCPKNELQKKCKPDCTQKECTLPKCKHQDYCATRIKELKGVAPKKTPVKKVLPTKKVALPPAPAPKKAPAKDPVKTVNAIAKKAGVAPTKPATKTGTKKTGKK
jgi:hypothetical protein